MLEPSYIKGITLLGGEPMEPQNQKTLLPFIKRIREKFGNSKNVWCYTGYLFDRDLLGESRAKCEATNDFLNQIDVLVDGPFVDELKNISLKFRGSENQRIIDVPTSLSSGEVVTISL